MLPWLICAWQAPEEQEGHGAAHVAVCTMRYIHTYVHIYNYIYIYTHTLLYIHTHLVELVLGLQTHQIGQKHQRCRRWRRWLSSRDRGVLVGSVDGLTCISGNLWGHIVCKQTSNLGNVVIHSIFCLPALFFVDPKQFSLILVVIRVRQMAWQEWRWGFWFGIRSIEESGIIMDHNGYWGQPVLFFEELFSRTFLGLRRVVAWRANLHGGLLS